MSDSGLAPTPQPTIESASAEAQNLLNRTLAGLRESSEAAADKFFPNGIELILIKVEAGLTATTKISVELKIAGPKGVEVDASGPET